MGNKLLRWLSCSLLVFGAMTGGGTALAKKGKDQTSHKVPPDYRGFPLPVDDYQAQYINPGDRIDLLVTFDAQFKDTKEKVSGA